MDSRRGNNQADVVLCRLCGGVADDLDNLLGARARYLYAGTRDTYFRIRDKNKAATIGRTVSSGCKRLFKSIFTIISRNTRRWWCAPSQARAVTVFEFASAVPTPAPPKRHRQPR